MENNQAQKDILELLHSVVDTEEALLRKQLATTRAARSHLKRVKSDSLTFSISILSMWSNEGEKSLENYRFTGDIETAINHAAAAFKQLVERSDIQARWHVSIVVKGRKSSEIILKVPEIYWEKHAESVSRSS